MKPEVLKSWSLEIDYSRAPCLGADQKVRGLWERDWQYLDVVPERRTKRCSPRFRPGDRFCEPSFRYLFPGSEGEKCWPLDHRWQIPFIHSAQFTIRNQFLYIYNTVLVISTIWYLQVCLGTEQICQLRMHLCRNIFLKVKSLYFSLTNYILSIYTLYIVSQIYGFYACAFVNEISSSSRATLSNFSCLFCLCVVFLLASKAKISICNFMISTPLGISLFIVSVLH